MSNSPVIEPNASLTSSTRSLTSRNMASFRPSRRSLSSTSAAYKERHVRCQAPDMSGESGGAVLEAARDDRRAAGRLDLDPGAGLDRREARAALVHLRGAEAVDPCGADLRRVHEEVDPLAREAPDVLDLD